MSSYVYASITDNGICLKCSLLPGLGVGLSELETWLHTIETKSLVLQQLQRSWDQSAWVVIRRKHSPKQQKAMIPHHLIHVSIMFSLLSGTSTERLLKSGNRQLYFQKHEVRDTSVHSQMHFLGQSGRC